MKAAVSCAAAVIVPHIKHPLSPEKMLSFRGINDQRCAKAAPVLLVTVAGTSAFKHQLHFYRVTFFTVFAALMASFIKLRFVLSCEIQTLEQQVMLYIKSAFVFDCIRVCVPSACSPSKKRNIWLPYQPVGTVNTHYMEKILYLG